MARPALALGDHGKADIAQLADGRWRARCRVRDSDGVVRQVVRYRPTKASASQALQAALKDRQAPTSALLKPSSTLADVTTAWLSDIDDSERAPDTKRVYRVNAELHVIAGPLGNVPVSQITVAALASALRRLAKLSGPGTAKTARTVYRGALDLAVHAKAMPANPVRNLPVAYTARQSDPEPGQVDHRRSLTRAERELLLDRLDADGIALVKDLPDLVAAMLATGCRIGEAIAIRWDRLNRPTLLVDAKIGRVKGEGLRLYDYTKGNRQAGIRSVTLPGWMWERLEVRRETAEFNQWGLVFASELNCMRDPSNTNADLREAYDRAGFHWLTSHTMRRTVATMLDDSGQMSRSRIANQLGHSSTRSLEPYLDKRATDPRAGDIL